jgi:hypothetical protein
MRKLHVLILVFALLLSAITLAEGTFGISGDYSYELLSDNTVIITFYSGDADTLDIPSELDGYKVSAIQGLSFYHDYNLTYVSIPDCVNYIVVNPFILCSKLSEIYVSPDHQFFSAVNGVLFSKNDRRLISYSQGIDANEYRIPQGIRIIGDGAFYGCDRLKNIIIPDGVTSIGFGAFESCDLLEAVIIPNSVTMIDEEAFAFCKSLTNVTIPDSVTSIGENAFDSCSDRLTITVGRDSYARQYCIDNGIKYTYTDLLDWLND